MNEEQYKHGLEYASMALFKGDCDRLDFMQRDLAMIAISYAQKEREGYETAIALATQVDGLNDKVENLQRLVDSTADRNIFLQKETEQLRILLNMYNLGGWTDSLALIKERDVLTAERDNLLERLAASQRESIDLTAERDALQAELNKCVEAARTALEGSK